MIVLEEAEYEALELLRKAEIDLAQTSSRSAPRDLVRRAIELLERELDMAAKPQIAS